MRKYWDNSVFLDNRAVKIFLNASGGQDDVSRELKAFQDYVAGVESEDDFVKRVAEAVREAKKNREWRHEYMTLLMRDQENIEKGIEEGIRTVIIQMNHKGLSIPEIADITNKDKSEIKDIIEKENRQC